MPINEKEIVWDSEEIQWDEPDVKTPMINFGDPLDGMPEEERSAIEPLMTQEDKDMVVATNYYNDKFSTNHTPEMVTAQIQTEYGDTATPAIANEKNDLLKDMDIFTRSLMKGAIAQMPKLRGEMAGLRDKWIGQTVDALGIDSKPLEQAVEATVSARTMTPFDLANKMWQMVPSDKLSEWGKVQVDTAIKTQSKHMSGVPLEQSIANKDFETAGKDFMTAVAFEAPRMGIQIGLGMLSPEASLEMMFATSAGSKRAEKDESDSLEERVLAPTAVGTGEIFTEKFLGTQRIIDKMAKGKFATGMKNKALEIFGNWIGGVTSEVGASFNENVVDKLSGKEVELSEGLFMAGAVGGFMDVGAGLMTLGDANRLRNKNTDSQLDEKLANGELTQEVVDVVKTPENERERAVGEYNEYILTPEEEAMSEDAMATAQKIKKEEGYVEGSAEAMEAQEADGGREAILNESREQVGATDIGQDQWIGETETDEEQNIRSRRSRLTSSLMTPVLSYIRDISPETYQRLNRFEFDAHQSKRSKQLESEDFLREFTELAKNDSDSFVKLDEALMNENFKEAEKYISKESIDKVRAMLESAADDMESVGLDLSRKDGYFPRRVKDYEGLKDELGSEIKGEIEKALAEQERKANDKGYTLNEEERSKVVNQVIAGSYIPVGGRKPRALKQRQIDEVTRDLAPYYYDSAESLLMWINDAVDVVETRKFFGKDMIGDGDIVDVNESIGAVIEKITERDNLTPEEQNKLIGALRARFGYRPTGKLASKYKSLVAMTTLGQVQNAITQFGDATWSFYENSIPSTIGATVGEKRVKMEDLAIEEVAEEFRTPDGLNSVVNNLFKYTGLKKIDRLGKEALINATLNQYESQAKDGKFTKDKQERLDVLFGDNQNAVISDLKSGEMTDDVKYLLFSTLLDWQPISLSNMPIQYLKNPNGRVLYTLKTFTIKQLDNFRTRAVDNIVEGIETGDAKLAMNGIGNLMRLSALFFMANLPIDLIKDWMTGKDIEFTDTMVDNLYKLIGLSRYSVEYATRGGRQPSKVIPDVIMPPTNFIDYPAEDIQTIKKRYDEGEDLDLMNLESWRMLPFAGSAIRQKFKEEKK